MLSNTSPRNSLKNLNLELSFTHMNLGKYKTRRATHPCDMYMVTFSAGTLLTDTRLRKHVQHIASAHKATVGLDI